MCARSVNALGWLTRSAGASCLSRAPKLLPPTLTTNNTSTFRSTSYKRSDRPADRTSEKPGAPGGVMQPEARNRARQGRPGQGAGAGAGHSGPRLYGRSGKTGSSRERGGAGAGPPAPPPLGAEERWRPPTASGRLRRAGSQVSRSRRRPSRILRRPSCSKKRRRRPLWTTGS